MEDKKVLLSIKDLQVKFRVRGRILTAIRGVTLDIYENESIAIVGESGAGKSVFTKAFAGMLDSNGFIDQGDIIFNDAELSDTVVPLNSYAKKTIASTWEKLNDYSKLEYGSEVFLKMKALEQEKEEKMTLSEEEREKADAEIKKLVVKRTELFNYKQTLDTSKEKAKVKETSAEISRLDGEIKALQKAKEEKIKAHKQAAMNDTAYNQAYDAKMAEYKKEGKLKALIVTGCLAQRYQQEIIDEIPEVDAVLGTTSYDHIVEAVEEALAGNGHVVLEDVDALPDVKEKRLVTTGGHYAYMKIAEGCDKHCTYCIIPKLRGNYRSVPMEKLLAEAKDLADQGVKELILVAQETTVYGKDLYGEKSLHKLLRELCKISGIQWIRILYCYPEEIYDELIQTIKEENKVCHYLDLPIQHASDAVLKRMGRRTSKAQLVEIIEKLRKEIPDISLRTTLITGFPGETQEQHEELKDFVDEMEFDRLGVFTYSPEEDTPAATMTEQIPEEVKEDRQAELMELQQEIAFDLAEDMVGREVLVMIEGKVADENAYVGRTYKDAPNVDGLIFINTDEELMSGDFARVRVTGALEYDLIGELI